MESLTSEVPGKRSSIRLFDKCIQSLNTKSRISRALSAWQLPARMLLSVIEQEEEVKLIA